MGATWHSVHAFALAHLGAAPDYLMQRLGNSASSFFSRRLLLEPDFEDAYGLLAQSPVERYLLPRCLLVQLWCVHDDQRLTDVVLCSLEPWLLLHCANLGRFILRFLLPWDDSILHVMCQHAVHIRLANTIDANTVPVQYPPLQAWAQALYIQWRETCYPGRALFHPQTVR